MNVIIKAITGVKSLAEEFLFRIRGCSNVMNIIINKIKLSDMTHTFMFILRSCFSMKNSEMLHAQKNATKITIGSFNLVIEPYKNVIQIKYKKPLIIILFLYAASISKTYIPLESRTKNRVKVTTAHYA